MDVIHWRWELGWGREAVACGLLWSAAGDETRAFGLEERKER